MKLRSAFILIQILAIPAAADPLGELRADSVTSHDALAEGQGVLVESADRTTEPGPAFGSVHVEASSIRVVTDHVYHNHTVAGSGLMEPETTTTTTSMHNATLKSGAPGQLAYVFLLGDAAIVEGTFVSRPATAAAHQDQWVIHDRAPLANSDPRVDLTFEGAGTVHVEGRFTLAVWDWPMTYEGDDSSGTIISGEKRSSTAGPVEQVHLRQVYLVVDEGSATFTIEEPEGFTVALTQARASTGTGHFLHGAVGSVAGRVLAGGDAEVLGEVQAELEPQGSRLAVSLTGTPDALVYEGKAVAISTPLAPDRMLPWWILAFLGAVVVVHYGRRLIQWRTFQAASGALDDGDMEVALAKAQRVKRGKHRGDAATIMAIAAIRLGEPERAESAIRRINDDEPSSAAIKECLLACLAGLRGDVEEAEARLEESHRLDANIQQAFDMASLRAILGRSRREPVVGYA